MSIILRVFELSRGPKSAVRTEVDKLKSLNDEADKICSAVGLSSLDGCTLHPIVNKKIGPSLARAQSVEDNGLSHGQFLIVRTKGGKANASPAPPTQATPLAEGPAAAGPPDALVSKRPPLASATNLSASLPQLPAPRAGPMGGMKAKGFPVTAPAHLTREKHPLRAPTTLGRPPVATSPQGIGEEADSLHRVETATAAEPEARANGSSPPEDDKGPARPPQGDDDAGGVVAVALNHGGGVDAAPPVHPAEPESQLGVAVSTVVVTDSGPTSSAETQRIVQEIETMRQSLLQYWEGEKLSLLQAQEELESKQTAYLSEALGKGLEQQEAMNAQMRRLLAEIEERGESSMALSAIQDANTKLAEEVGLLRARLTSAPDHRAICEELRDLRGCLAEATAKLENMSHQTQSSPSWPLVTAEPSAGDPPPSASIAVREPVRVDDSHGRQPTPSTEQPARRAATYARAARVAEEAAHPITSAERSESANAEFPVADDFAEDVRGKRYHLEVLGHLCQVVEPLLTSSEVRSLLHTFRDSLTELYDALLLKHGIALLPTRGSVWQCLQRHLPFLTPAADAIAFLHQGHEAEYLESIVVRHRSIRPECIPPAAWVEISGGPQAREQPYFFSAITGMTQRARPRLAHATSIDVIRIGGFSSVSQKYNVVNPTVSELGTAAGRFTRSEIAAFIVIHRQELLGSLDHLLNVFRGREVQLLRTLQSTAGKDRFVV